jgi:NADPH:quinone reductase-like Zn-dependent oxidoreductase
VPGKVLGNEGVGVVEEVGEGVRNFKPGDRVLLPAVRPLADALAAYRELDLRSPGWLKVALEPASWDN